MEAREQSRRSSEVLRTARQGRTPRRKAVDLRLTQLVASYSLAELNQISNLASRLENTTRGNSILMPDCQWFQTKPYEEANVVAVLVAKKITQLYANNCGTPVIAVWLERGLEFALSISATTYPGATWLSFDPDVSVDCAATVSLTHRSAS